MCLVFPTKWNSDVVLLSGPKTHGCCPSVSIAVINTKSISNQGRKESISLVCPHHSLSEEVRAETQGGNLDVRTDAEAMKEC